MNDDDPFLEIEILVYGVLFVLVAVLGVIDMWLL